MQQRTIDKLRKKLTKERKRRSKIQGKLKLSQEQSLQLQEALNAANKENEIRSAGLGICLSLSPLGGLPVGARGYQLAPPLTAGT